MTLKKIIFDDAMKDWIWSNIKNGVSKQSVYEILIRENYDEYVVINELRYAPRHQYDLKLNSPDSVINQLTYLGAERIDAPIPIFRYQNLLSEEECQEIIAIHKHTNEPSTTGQDKDIKNDLGRISFSTFYEHQGLLRKHTALKTLKLKILGLTGLSIKLSEPLQGQWYKPGGFYNDHFDANHIAEKINPITGNRTWTCMVNLNVPEEGGDTYFPKLDKTFKPMTGQALIWYNLNEEGLAHPMSLHTGKHITKGEKFISNQWFQEYPKPTLT